MTAVASSVTLVSGERAGRASAGWTARGKDLKRVRMDAGAEKSPDEGEDVVAIAYCCDGWDGTDLAVECNFLGDVLSGEWVLDAACK